MQLRKWLSWYANTWLKSITSFAFYHDLSTRPLRNVLAFTLISYAILSLVQAGIFAKQVVPKFAELMQSIPAVVEEQLVPESNLSWDGEKLRLEPAQDISFALPADLQQDGLPEILFFSGAEQAKPTIINLTTDSLLIRTNGEPQSLSLTEVLGPETFSLSRPEVIKFLQQTSERTQQLLYALQYFLPIAFLFTYSLSRGIFLLIETALLYFVLRIYRRPTPLKDLIKLTLHILVLAEVVNQWATVVLPQSPISVLSLSFWVLVIVVLLQKQKHPNR